MQTKMVATVSGESLGKMLSKSARVKSVDSIVHLNAVANLDILFRHAILEESRPDRHGDRNIRQLHHFVVPMAYRDRIFQARILAKEFAAPEQGTRLYEVSAVEIKEAHVNRGEVGDKSLGSVPPVSLSNQFIRLHQAVKERIARSGGESAKYARAKSARGQKSFDEYGITIGGHPDDRGHQHAGGCAPECSLGLLESNHFAAL